MFLGTKRGLITHELSDKIRQSNRHGLFKGINRLTGTKGGTTNKRNGITYAGASAIKVIGGTGNLGRLVVINRKLTLTRGSSTHHTLTGVIEGVRRLISSFLYNRQTFGTIRTNNTGNTTRTATNLNKGTSKRLITTQRAGHLGKGTIIVLRGVLTETILKGLLNRLYQHVRNGNLFGLLTRDLKRINRVVGQAGILFGSPFGRLLHTRNKLTGFNGGLTSVILTRITGILEFDPKVRKDLSVLKGHEKCHCGVMSTTRVVRRRSTRTKWGPERRTHDNLNKQSFH